MPETNITCPKCSQEGAIWFYSRVENGAPHGAGYWPMDVSDSGQECDCTFTEAEFTELSNAAWKPFQDADNAYAAELAEQYAELDKARLFPDYDEDTDPGLCTLCSHWQQEHTDTDCEACMLNDAQSVHTFNQAP